MGGGYFEVKYSKCQDLPKFQFSGGGRYSGTKFKNRGVPENSGKHLLFEVNCTETCLCIIDSLSHTTYLETKTATFDGYINDLHSFLSIFQIKGALPE